MWRYYNADILSVTTTTVQLYRGEVPSRALMILTSGPTNSFSECWGPRFVPGSISQGPSDSKPSTRGFVFVLLSLITFSTRSLRAPLSKHMLPNLSDVDLVHLSLTNDISIIVKKTYTVKHQAYINYKKKRKCLHQTHFLFLFLRLYNTNQPLATPCKLIQEQSNITRKFLPRSQVTLQKSSCALLDHKSLGH